LNQAKFGTVVKGRIDKGDSRVESLKVHESTPISQIYQKT